MVAAGETLPLLPQYRLVARSGSRSVYEKYDSVTGIKTTLAFEGDTVHVRKTQRVDDIIDLNKAQQNDFAGFKGEMTNMTRVPTVEWNRLMEACGRDETGQYDERKLRAILDDADYRYFKTIPGKLGRATVMI